MRTTQPVAFAVPKDLVESDVLLGGTGTRLVVTFHTGPFLMAAKPRSGGAESPDPATPHAKLALYPQHSASPGAAGLLAGFES